MRIFIFTSQNTLHDFPATRMLYVFLITLSDVSMKMETEFMDETSR